MNILIWRDDYARIMLRDYAEATERTRRQFQDATGDNVGSKEQERVVGRGDDQAPGDAGAQREAPGQESDGQMTKRPMTEAEENLVSCAISMFGTESTAARRAFQSAMEEWVRRVQNERQPTPTKEEVEKLREQAMVTRRAYRAAHIALYARDPDDDTLRLEAAERAVVEAAKALYRYAGAQLWKPGDPEEQNPRGDLWRAVRRLP